MHAHVFLGLLAFSPLTLARVALPNTLQLTAGTLALRQTSPCASACSSSTDLAAAQAIAACGTSVDLACVCNNAATVSSGCLTCILSPHGLTIADLDQECQLVEGTGVAGGGGSSVTLSDFVSFYSSTTAAPTDTATLETTSAAPTSVASGPSPAESSAGVTKGGDGGESGSAGTGATGASSAGASAPATSGRSAGMRISVDGLLWAGVAVFVAMIALF